MLSAHFVREEAISTYEGSSNCKNRRDGGNKEIEATFFSCCFLLSTNVAPAAPAALNLISAGRRKVPFAVASHSDSFFHGINFRSFTNGRQRKSLMWHFIAVIPTLSSFFLSRCLSRCNLGIESRKNVVRTLKVAGTKKERMTEKVKKL